MVACSAVDSWSHHHFAFFLQYFVVAVAQSLPLSALSLILQIDLDGRNHPEEVNTFYANALLAPAFFKPFPGGLSDWLRLRGIGRRQVLVVIYILWFAALFEVADSRSRGSYFVFYTAVALCNGAAEAVLDGATVELMQELDLSGAEVQSTAFAFKTAGSLVASAASPVTLAMFSSHYASAKVCAIVPILAIPISMYASFPTFVVRRPAGCSVKCSRGLLFGAFFLFIRGAVPTESDTFYSFLSYQVNAVTLGVCNTMSNIGGFLALVSFQALPTKITQNLRLTILTTTTLAAMVGGLVRYFLAKSVGSPPWMYVVCAALVGAVDSLSFLPNLAICADCSPKDFGALGFALLSLVLDLGDQVSARLAAALTEDFQLGYAKDRSWSHLGSFVVVCRLSMLLPLCLLPGFSRQQLEVQESQASVRREEGEEIPVEDSETPGS